MREVRGTMFESNLALRLKVIVVILLFHVRSKILGPVVKHYNYLTQSCLSEFPFIEFLNPLSEERLYNSHLVHRTSNLD
ncbi:hypothetical protein, partial [Desulfosporosinus acididurans]|uniref:hypothetical protein n=1 Tax=Desulfosporosinus acididurans TaxID=476652 RepID=UPI001A9A3EED